MLEGLGRDLDRMSLIIVASLWAGLGDSPDEDEIYEKSLTRRVAILSNEVTIASELIRQLEALDDVLRVPSRGLMVHDLDRATVIEEYLVYQPSVDYRPAHHFSERGAEGKLG